MEIGYENGNERMKMFRSVLSVYLSVYFNSKSRKFVVQIAAAPTMIYLFFFPLNCSWHVVVNYSIEIH